MNTWLCHINHSSIMTPSFQCPIVTMLSAKLLFVGGIVFRWPIGIGCENVPSVVFAGTHQPIRCALPLKINPSLLRQKVVPSAIELRYLFFAWANAGIRCGASWFVIKSLGHAAGCWWLVGGRVQMRIG